MNNDVSKKRKKTSKEKRVLVASLGIAAVVAAGSTFAWFTSQDEVTNRLSANAAYDVSVIETFTPPTNWTPGQKVNKDTSAVNTGNIPAFVKQKLSGKMQVTLEQAEKNFDIAALEAENANPNITRKKKYIELTEDEVDVIEAGGFLAWASNGDTPIGIKKGGAEATTDQCYLGEVSAVHSEKNFDDMDPTTDDFYRDLQFAPPATGDYIFRRVIDVAADGTETYEYKGYHFDQPSGKYYEIKVINGLLPEEDGILTAKPTVYYGVEVNDVADLPLRYEPHDVRKYLLFQPTNSGNFIKKQYSRRNDTITNEYGDSFTKYTVDNGHGEFTLDYYLCTAIVNDPESAAKVGTIYTALPAANPIGKVSGTINDYDKVIDTPDRLVATYEVAKSDDVYINDPVPPTDLSDFTADNYDTKLRELAKSDYLIARAKYENAKAQYELNKKAYEAGTALLTALAKNEEILAAKQTKVNEAIAAFNGTIEKLEFTAPANVAPFTTGAETVNPAFGVVSDSQLPKVKTFIEKVTAYQKDPTTAKWKGVTDAYDAVTAAFTAGNDELSKLEKNIVIAWNEAALAQGFEQLIKMEDLGEYAIPENASPACKAAKAAATQLIAWEKTISDYQQAVNKYFTSLSDVQSDAKYKLQDLRPLEKAYEDAVDPNKATAPKYVTNETRSGDDQTGIATEMQPGGTITVENAYKIVANGTALTKVGLNDEKAVPIKNSISDDGYAGTKITDITGTNQFTIGDKTIAAQEAGNKPTYDDQYDADYNAKKAVYDRYKSEHTNQDVNNDIVIYINLNNIGNGTVEDQWKLSPTLVPGDTEANFYYTSILGGGEVSSILVDSVELSGDTSNYAFKEFDFDLNVTVDSAQVVVSEDGRSYESTAVNANDQFIAKPAKAKYDKEEAKPVKDNTIVDWT